MAYRVERVNAEMQKSISLTLQNKIKDPRIAGFMIGVTSVDCAKDLKTAKVYVSIYGKSGADKQAAFKAVQSSSGFIRRELAADLKDIRTVPELKFVSDESGAYGEKIDGILNAINKEKG